MRLEWRFGSRNDARRWGKKTFSMHEDTQRKRNEEKGGGGGADPSQVNTSDQ